MGNWWGFLGLTASASLPAYSGVRGGDGFDSFALRRLGDRPRTGGDVTKCTTAWLTGYCLGLDDIVGGVYACDFYLAKAITLSLDP